jgi:hypothetical protein
MSGESVVEQPLGDDIEAWVRAVLVRFMEAGAPPPSTETYPDYCG